MLRITLTILALLFASPTMAYIGPGAGISVLGSLFGIIVTIIVAIGAIIMWPLRKLFRIKKKKKPTAETDEAQTEATTGNSD